MSEPLPLPYKISTLLYCFNAQGEVLLLNRTREPNRGLWSPPGGKLKTADGESPYVCACREAREEMGLRLLPCDLHLAGLISERGYQGQAHWLMFLFEVLSKLESVPPPHPEGTFAFFAPDKLPFEQMPRTDIEQLWPLFWKYRKGFFSAHCDCFEGGENEWTVEETQP
jgi:8-oxo-dGTP diphosphatase